MTCTRGSKIAVPPPPLNQGLALIKYRFCLSSSAKGIIYQYYSYGSAYQKHLKLSQCLEIDDRKSLTKFGDVTLPRSHFANYSVFYRCL